MDKNRLMHDWPIHIPKCIHSYSIYAYMYIYAYIQLQFVVTSARLQKSVKICLT